MKQNKAFHSFILRLLLSFASIVVLQFSSCADGNSDYVILYTESPALAEYAWKYNTDHPSTPVAVKYTDNAAGTLLGGTDRIDIAAGAYFTSSQVKGKLKTLNSLFSENKLNDEKLYTQLMQSCFVGNNIHALPVSFDVPVILYKKQSDDTIFQMDIEDIKTTAAAFNRKRYGHFVKMGFSPEWSRDFLYMLAVFNNGRIHLDDSDSLVWNEKGLLNAVSYAVNWVSEKNGSLTDSHDFYDKYCYEPDYKLLEEGRIKYSVASVGEYMAIPEEKRRNISFFYPSRDERILINDDVLYIGIAENSIRSREAMKFISWLISSDTQKDLIKAGERIKSPVIAFAGGFSSIMKVNETILIETIPELRKKIPLPGQLVGPGRLPVKWSVLRESVIEEWLIEATTNMESIDVLEQQIENWFLKQSSHANHLRTNHTQSSTLSRIDF